MSGVLIVTWDGGGNVPPALGIAAELVDRGHDVVVLGHPQQRDAVEAMGARARSHASLPAWDPRRHAGSARFALAYLSLFTDRRFGEEVRRAIVDLDPDVVVVDVLLPSAMSAAVDSGRPTVVLVHTLMAGVEAMARGPVGRLAALKGYSFRQGLEGADAVVIASPEALAVSATSTRSQYVGPIFGPRERGPAASDPGSDRVLVSLSTIHYPGMESVLQSLLDAVAMLPIEAIVTTGPTIDPADLRRPRNAEVHRRVPHDEVLPQVGLVIGHGGHGTATKALTAGVPVLVRAVSGLGDHVYVAAGLEHAGVGRRLSRRASTDDLGALISGALGNAPLRERARALGRGLRTLDGAKAGADIIEQTADVASESRSNA